MKKTCVTALAALLLAVPAVQAQKVNKDSFLSKIEKSDADIAAASSSSRPYPNRRRTCSSKWTP